MGLQPSSVIAAVVACGGLAIAAGSAAGYAAFRGLLVPWTVASAGSAVALFIALRRLAVRSEAADEASRDAIDLRAALDEHAIVAMTDPQGRITFVNDRFCAISQYSRPELIGRDHRLINSKYHSKAFMHDLWATIKAGRVWRGEIRNRAKDGTFYWVDSTMVPFRGRDGAIRRFVAIRADVTARKRAEESIERLAAIVADSDDAIVSKSLDGTILTWNRGAEAIFGYAAAEAIGRNVAMLIPPDRPDEETDIMARIRRGEKIERFETVRRRKDGSLFSASITISPLRDTAGNIVGASKIARDITAEKRAEMEIHRLNRDLERRVAERTAELEAANRDLESFSYSVSHDLRAPLRMVDGFSRALLEDFGTALPAEGKRQVETIRQGARRMADLIEDLLTFSRLSRAPLTRRAVDMRGLVADTLTTLEPECAGRRIEFCFGDLPPTNGDLSLLRQVWANLIGNAIKYTRRREKALVEVGCVPGSLPPVYFVRDNGAGFDMRYAHKLFGVFQRLHRAEEYEGTGVGLAIVERVVRRHGGRVWAEAEVEKGASFYFTAEPPPSSRE